MRLALLTLTIGIFSLTVNAQVTYNYLLGSENPSGFVSTGSDSMLVASVFTGVNNSASLRFSKYDKHSGRQGWSWSLNDSLDRRLTESNTLQELNGEIFLLEISNNGKSLVNELIFLNHSHLDTAHSIKIEVPKEYINAVLQDVCVVSDSIFMAVGMYYDTTRHHLTGIVLSFDKNGKALHHESFIHPRTSVNVQEIKRVGNNRFVICGRYANSSKPASIMETNFLYVFDSLCSIVWNKNYRWKLNVPGSRKEGFGTVYASSDSTFMFVMRDVVSLDSNNNYMFRIHLRTYNVDNTLIEDRYIGPSSILMLDPNSAISLCDSGILIYGNSNAYWDGLLKLDQKGFDQWYYTYRADTINDLFDRSSIVNCISSSDSGAICIGLFQYNAGKIFTSPGFAEWLFKIDKNGNTCKVLNCIQTSTKPISLSQLRKLKVLHGNEEAYVKSEKRSVHALIYSTEGKLLFDFHPNKREFFIPRYRELAPGMYIIVSKDLLHRIETAKFYKL